MATSRPLTVVVTGSECTGKTTLAERLAARLGAPWSREFVREYVDRKQTSLDASDVEPIARGQLAGEHAADDAARRQQSRVVIRDTDLLSTVVYSRYYYGSCPRWIESAAREQAGDLYVLLRPDVPWVADGLQRDRPDESSRADIHRLFHDAIAATGARVVEIGGDWASREAASISAIESTMRARGAA
jgi:NadR type nicotinamide-nucleotide adenylyltransferase